MKVELPPTALCVQPIILSRIHGALGQASVTARGGGKSVLEVTIEATTPRIRILDHIEIRIWCGTLLGYFVTELGGIGRNDSEGVSVGDGTFR